MLASDSALVGFEHAISVDFLVELEPSKVLDKTALLLVVLQPLQGEEQHIWRFFHPILCDADFVQVLRSSLRCFDLIVVDLVS